MIRSYAPNYKKQESISNNYLKNLTYGSGFVHLVTFVNCTETKVYYFGRDNSLIPVHLFEYCSQSTITAAL